MRVHINFNFLKSNLRIFTCTEQLKLSILFGFYLDSPKTKQKQKERDIEKRMEETNEKREKQTNILVKIDT